MVKRKKAMGAGRRPEKIKPQKVIVVEGIDRHKSTLEEITEDALIKLNFLSRAGSLFISEQLRFYNGCKVYIREQDSSDSQEPTLLVYQHGTLDTDCTTNKDIYYGIRYIKSPSFLDFHNTPELKEMIVVGN